MFRKKKQISDIDIEKEALKQELREAIEERQRAENIFNCADTEYVEVAIMQIQAAELTLSTVLQRCRLFEHSTGERLLEKNELLGNAISYADIKTFGEGE